MRERLQLIMWSFFAPIDKVRQQNEWMMVINDRYWVDEAEAGLKELGDYYLTGVTIDVRTEDSADIDIVYSFLKNAPRVIARLIRIFNERRVYVECQDCDGAGEGVVHGEACVTCEGRGIVQWQ